VSSELVQLARLASVFNVVRNDVHVLEIPLGMYELLAARAPLARTAAETKNVAFIVVVVFF